MTELALIGADPEVFLKIKDTDFFVPSLDMIGGSKESPLRVDKGALQEDNVAAEFNVDPTDNAEEFSNTVFHVMDQLNDKVGNNVELSIQASAEFEAEMLDDPRAQAIGCDPDFNAYTNKQNKYEIDYETSGVRYAGGHIHLGSKSITTKPKELLALVKMMDLHVGTLLTFLDTDTKRLRHYGRAGNYRVKPYGVEYRTASNFWLTSRELTKDIHKLSQRAFHLWNTGVAVSPQGLDLAINNRDIPTLYNVIPMTTKEVLRKYS